MSRLREVPKIKWWTKTSTSSNREIVQVFKNDRFLVQIRKQGDTIRISVNRVDYQILEDGTPNWLEGITWDDLQQIKNECGYRDKWMCEYYPPESEVVNIANIRHLWLMDEAPKHTLRDNHD